MAGFDLDRLQRFARGFAVLFYALLFLAFITAVMGSGGGGLLLLVLAAAAHVGRVGLEELVARREGNVEGIAEDDPGERATGLRLKWLPRELRLGGAGGVAARSGEAAGGALGRAGEMLGTARANVTARAGIGSSFSALVAEVRESRRDRETSIEADADFPPLADDYAAGEVDFAPLVEDDFEELDFSRRDFAEDDFESPVDFEDAPADFDEAFEAEPEREFEREPVAGALRSERGTRSANPNAQERYEARERARRERSGAEPAREEEPLVAAVEAAESEPAPSVRRRRAGGRPDPLRSRRPISSL